MLRYIRYIGFGILAGLCFWIMDVLVDAAILRVGTISQQLYNPGAVEIWMRMAVLFLMVAFSLLAGHQLEKNRRDLRIRRESEERLQLMVRTASDPIICFNQEGVILIWNQAAETIFGYTAREMEGCSINRLLPEYFRNSRERTWRYLQLDHLPLPPGKNLLLNFINSRDLDVPTETSLTPLKLGEEQAYLAIVRDITSRIELLQHLLDSEAQFRLMAESSPDIIYQVNESGEISYISPALEQNTGYSPEELEGSHFNTIVDRPYHERVTETFRKVMQSQSVELVEIVINKKDGSSLPFEITFGPLVNQGTVVGVQGTARNILSRIHLQEQMRLLARVFESTLEGIVITDSDSVIQAVNPAYCRLTGYEERELIGNKPNVLRSGRHDREFYKRMWRSIQKTDVWQGEIWDRKKSGELFVAWLSIARVGDPLGRNIRFVGILQDITDRKIYEENIKYQAYHDVLTNLPNRVLLMDRLGMALEQARRNLEQLAVMYIDLDGFKAINDSQGHLVGDQVLQMVAHRMREKIRAGDTLARVGGDEFILIFPRVTCPEHVQEISQKLLTAFEEPFTVDNRSHTVTASIGVALFPEHGSTGEDLIKKADDAMYKIKHQGKNGYLVYS